jgi:hypothetical protein
MPRGSAKSTQDKAPNPQANLSAWPTTSTPIIAERKSGPKTEEKGSLHGAKQNSATGRIIEKAKSHVVAFAFDRSPRFGV